MRATCLLALAVVSLAGCSHTEPLVVEYSPDRRFTLEPGLWMQNASVKPSDLSQGRLTALERGEIVDVVSGGHDVIRFARQDEAATILCWVELDRGQVVSAWMWAREFHQETTWFVGSAGHGTGRVDERDDDDISGALDLTFEGRKETARSGISGPFVFRLSGDFEASTRPPQ